MKSAAWGSDMPSCESLAGILRGTAIVILTWNQREKTSRCLHSIADAGYDLGRVVLWDNGSQDGTDELVLSRFPSVIYHHHPTNQGVASGRNSAALLAERRLSPTHLMFLDNDMVVTRGCLELLCQPFTTDARLAQAMAKIRFMSQPKRLHSAGGQVINFALGMKGGTGYLEVDRGQHDEQRHCLPSGGATLVSKDVFFELDGFDSVFDPFGAEDTDFSYRVKAAGYRAVYVPDAVLYHDYSNKMGEGGGARSYMAARVRQWMILMRRHATPAERIAFFCGGALIGFLKVALTAAARGKAGALLGIPGGVRDYAGQIPQPDRPAQPTREVRTETD
jgi:GT2 family glycosyltransferase